MNEGFCIKKKNDEIANGCFDQPTFGLWAQRASAAPVRFRNSVHFMCVGFSFNYTKTFSA